jgi:hypothetical protein
VTIEDDRKAAMRLAGQIHDVGRVAGRDPWRAVLRWVSGGRRGQRSGWPVVPRLDTPWQDTISPERTWWRQRAANLNGVTAFAVDYRICRRCRMGWVEWPYTAPQYQRCGLASAGLAALRAEHPGVGWHTLGGHFRSSRAFWDSVGENVPGGYRQQPLCSHLEASG